MKNKKLMKAAAVVMVSAMTMSLMACGSTQKVETKAEETATEAVTEAQGSNEEEKKELNIAVVKQLDHASLDEIANAIVAELDAIAKEQGITINSTVYSGQGEESTLKQIGDQVISEGVDAIIPIATLAAQVMTVCAEETETPVIYAAISDPEAAELTDISYVTGTSDALNTEFIMDMMLTINPDIKNVGLLYSLSEANSAAPIAAAKEYLGAKNIEYTEVTANTNDEVIQAASILTADQVDAVFTPTDNIIMAAELSIAETLAEAGIPHYTGADSFVRNGGFTTCGVNYTDLGTKTADLAIKAINEGMAGLEDYYLMDGGIITVNTETAEMLKIDYSAFKEMGELVEVTTTED